MLFCFFRGESKKNLLKKEKENLTQKVRFFYFLTSFLFQQGIEYFYVA